MILTTDRISKLLLRFFITKKRTEALNRLRHWGLEEEALGGSSFFEALISLAWLSFTLYLTVTRALPVIGAYSPGESSPLVWAILWCSLGYLHARYVLNGYHYANSKRQALEALPKPFHDRFSVSEILSMYECLRAAPAIFWEEYVNLPDWQVSKSTNREFRERVAPYVVNQGEKHQRNILLLTVLIIVLTVLTVGVAFLTLLSELLDTTFIDWIKREILGNLS